MYPGALRPGILTGVYQCPNDEHTMHDVLLVGHPAELAMAARLIFPDGDMSEADGGIVVKAKEGDDNATYLVLKPATPAAEFLKQYAEKNGETGLPF